MENQSQKKFGKYVIPEDFDTAKAFYVVEKNAGEPVFKHLDKVIDSNKHLWTTNGGAKVISLVGLQTIQFAEDIVEKKITVDVLPNSTNHQQHVVNIWLGFRGDNNPDNWARGSGEASVLNTGKVENHKDASGNVTQKVIEMGNVSGQYKFSMADKRAFSRALCKLIHLHGVYGNVEAADFAKINYDDEGIDF